MNALESLLSTLRATPMPTGVTRAAAEGPAARPEPGVYHDVPLQDYLAWDAVSASRLSAARRSLAHYAADVGAEPTPSLQLGALVHCGVLEPAAIADRYVVLPDFENDPGNRTAKGAVPSSPRATAYYRDCVREFAAANPDKVVVCRDEYDATVGVAGAIAACPRAGQWLREPGPVELCLVWIDPPTGLRCKARLDKAAQDWAWIADLKTTRDGAAFERALATYGYHRQLAHYAAGVAALGLYPVPETRIIAVETVRPWSVRSAPVSLAAMRTGAEERRELLDAIAKAGMTHEWPGYQQPEEWRLPDWYGGGPIELIGPGGERMSL